MNEEKKMDAIISAIPWRCYHCDFITNDPAEAEAHFGERDDAEEFKPICKWWDRIESGDERLKEYQDLLREFKSEQERVASQMISIEGLEFQLGLDHQRFNGYKPFRDAGVTSVVEAFQLYDSMEGRALAAEEKVINLTKSLRDAVERIKGREYTADLLAMAEIGGIP